jgi:Na+/H+ antiporter NhaD/arsenite permease-like protein
MPLVAAIVVIGCTVLAVRIWHRRQGRERTAEFDDAVARVREELKEKLEWQRAVLPAAAILALVLLATLARNPSRWALLLVALAALAAGTTVFVVRERRRRADHQA